MTSNDDKKGLTSIEAAALYLSDGATKDPALANHMAEGGNGFDMDGLQRAHLRRMMGFDFNVTVDEKKNTLTVSSKEGPEVHETAEFSGLFDEAAVDVLVDACLAVKLKWDAEQSKIADKNNAQEGEVVEDETR